MHDAGGVGEKAIAIGVKADRAQGELDGRSEVGESEVVPPCGEFVRRRISLYVFWLSGFPKAFVGKAPLEAEVTSF